MNSTTLSLSRMKPLGKWGTVGVGVSYSYMFGKDNFGEEISKMGLGYNFPLLNMVKVNERIMYTPTLVFTKPNIIYRKDGWV